MLKNIVFSSLLLILFGCAGQKIGKQSIPDEEAKVRQVIHQLFDAMRSSDSTIVRQLFMPKAQAYTIAISKKAGPKLLPGNVEAFIQAIGSPKEVIWDERIANLEIQVDGAMATAWMDYAFYLGDKFSHCGVNNMVLFKEESRWKIFFLSDTRRRSNCAIKEE